MRMSWKAVLAIGLLILGIIFYPRLAEAFQPALPTAKNLDDICKARSSCSTCLAPIEGDVRGSCGWCEGAQKCVARAGTRPVVPKVSDKTEVRRILEERNATLRAEGKPEIRITGNEVLDAFQCPVDEFVINREKCKDFQCSSILNCNDCAGLSTCGWCAADGVCRSKTTTGEPVPADSCARDKFVTVPGSCPSKPCETIGDCQECARTKGCAYCKTIKRCIYNEIPRTDPKYIECQVFNRLTFPDQCTAGPSDIKQTSEDSDDKPTRGQLAAAQDNTISGRGGSGNATPGLVAAKPRPKAPASAQGRMMSDPGTVTAPGLARPLGSTSERPTYPDAADLYSSPIDEYIQMLVRSELASLGVPTNEPFQVSDVVSNAGTFIESTKRKILSMSK